MYPIHPRAAGARLDLLRQVSGGTPFADCTADNPPSQPGQVFLSTEVEPWIAVNPVDPLNLVGTWQQDRWSNGAARGLSVGVSLDGGISWQASPVPGLTRCSDGFWMRASDPWLSFGPTGDLFHIALTLIPSSVRPNAMLVTRSTDGGLTWGEPLRLVMGSLPFFHDKESITADPTDPDFIYATWDRIDFIRGRGPAIFTRSSDGGESWEPVRVIHDPGRNNQTLAAQIVVVPEGTVLDFFTEIFNVAGGRSWFLAFKRSTSKGETWSPSLGSFRVAQMRPLTAVDPDLGIDVRDGANLFDVAVDRRNGHLYAVWQDGGPTGQLYPVVLFTRSIDGGQSWSTPVPVNRTPSDVDVQNRQAFTPSVHVSDGGTIGVSYYDFRLNDPQPGSLTDHWLTWCHPEAVDCTRADRWRHEVRLTDESFDIVLAPFANGLFLGDYVGLAAAGNDFLAFFTQPHDLDLTSAFFRRVALEETVEPEGLGFWKHQVRVASEGGGRAQESASSLLDYLADIRTLHDLFDDVDSLEELDAVLDPPRPPSMAASARAHTMALLLNLASERIVPFAVVTAEGTVADAVALLTAILEDPGSTRHEREAAKDLAETINAGAIPVG
jgi:hypothetical protein